jgi:hypothetical protein
VVCLVLGEWKGRVAVKVRREEKKSMDLSSRVMRGEGQYRVVLSYLDMFFAKVKPIS